ncbi:haptoglobin-like [Tiliqua scincoides]|uniref:haptoglobin-like n=1 Tax=Tiliqua scincoides TaxID=71010 RepID=UPI003462A1D6
MRTLGPGLVWGVVVLVTSGGCAPVSPNATHPPGGSAQGHVVHLAPHQCDPYYRLQNPSKGLHRFDQQKQLWVNQKGEVVLPSCEPVCGRPKSPVSPVQRIIGGFMAARNSFPWQVKLVTRRNRIAGATLISDRWLLTTSKNLQLNHTAEAPAEEVAPTLQLFLGDGRPAGPVDRVVLHPDFPGEVDLALLRLQHRVPIGEAVMPICLPKRDYVRPGRVGFIAGWGRNVFLAHPEYLRYVQLPVADSGNCTAYYAAHDPLGPPPVLGKRTFCVGMSELQENTCYGDAGGAFAVQDPKDEAWYAAGILSFDKTCAYFKFSVYVRLLSVTDWIWESLATA